MTSDRPDGLWADGCRRPYDRAGALLFQLTTLKRRSKMERCSLVAKARFGSGEQRGIPKLLEVLSTVTETR